MSYMSLNTLILNNRKVKNVISFLFLLITSFLMLAFVDVISAESKLEKKVTGSPGDYGIAGCGPGSLIWAKRDKNEQILAASTNGFLFPTQLAAITLDVSNCDAPRNNAFYHKRERENFVLMNYDFLKQEMATGQGQNIDSLAVMMGCTNNVSFKNMSRKNHDYFFEVQRANPRELIKRIESKIKSDSVLSPSCNHLSIFS